MKNEKLEKNKSRFLENLKKAANAATKKEEVSQQLGFKNLKEFEEFLKADKEAGDIWDEARLNFWIESKASITKAAKEGKAVAIQILDRLLQEEQSDSTITENITATQLSKLVGKSGQTIHNWVNKNGLLRNKDKTFNLPQFFIWFAKYKFDLGKKSVGTLKSSNTLQAVKTKKLELELAQARGDLLDRKEVLAGITARSQRLIQQHSRLTDLATQLEGKNFQQVIDILDVFFSKLIRTQQEEFTELKLPTKVRNQFLKVLEALSKEQ